MSGKLPHSVLLEIGVPELVHWLKREDKDLWFSTIVKIAG